MKPTSLMYRLLPRCVQVASVLVLVSLATVLHASHGSSPRRKNVLSRASHTSHRAAQRSPSYVTHGTQSRLSRLRSLHSHALFKDFVASYTMPGDVVESLAGQLNNHSGCSVDPEGMVKAPKKFPTILVLPGFGNAQQDYVEMLGSQLSLTGSLNARGFRATVLPIERVDWLKVAKGLFSINFGNKPPPLPSPSYSWYVQKINETVSELLTLTNEEEIVLLAHSAGGWLARAYLAELGEQARVKALVTLGTPHTNEGGYDVTRGLLPFINSEFPGAYHNDVRYITVAGRAVEGNTGSKSKRQKAAFAAYHQVCGEGKVMGDGTVPTHCAHLDGAVQVTLDNVWHSVDKPDSWYGSDGVIDSWLWCLCDACDDICPTRRDSSAQLP